MYLLDRPTTGLHWLDVQKLMDLLFRLRDAGNTLVVIEHNLDVIRLADHVVEIGLKEKGRDSCFFEGVPNLLTFGKNSYRLSSQAFEKS